MGLSPIKSTPVTTLEDRSWLKDLEGLRSGVSITLDGTSVRAVIAAGGHLPSGAVLAKRASDAKAVLYAGTSEEIQHVAITGAPTGGTYTLTWNSQTTTALAYNAAPAAVQAALEALSNIAPGDVVVSGTAAAYDIKYQGADADTNVAQISATSSLTGGSSPAATPSTTTAGGTDLGSGGSGTAVGFLHSGGTVPAAGDMHVTYLHRVDVIEANLPPELVGKAGGLDASAKADLTHCSFF